MYLPPYMVRILCWPHLEKAHIAERIDYRSHKDRGLDTLPTVKMGWEATQIDRTADRMLEQGKVSQRSFLGEINREIESLNRDIKGVQAELQDLQLEIQVQNRKPPQEIQKQIELTAVSEPVAQPKPQTPLETHRKPIDPQENKQATTVPQLQKKANQEQNRPINEPSKNDINQKQGLILEYAEKAQTIAKAILDSQLKALREEAKPILEKYHTLKDSKPLMFGKEQWQKDTDNALKQYNAIKNAVSIRPYPIAEASKHEVANHQWTYLYASADVLAHPPNRHTGQAHSI